MADHHSILEGILLDEGHSYTLVEFCEICVIEENTITEMIEFGIIAPQGEKERWVFDSRDLMRTQKALRLQKDLDINWPGISLALDLLEELHELRELLDTYKGNQGQ